MCAPLRAIRVLGVCKNGIFPVNISHHIRESPPKLFNECMKVAGRFFSKKKCPIQANV